MGAETQTLRFSTIALHPVYGGGQTASSPRIRALQSQLNPPYDDSYALQRRQGTTASSGGDRDGCAAAGCLPVAGWYGEGATAGC
ncbi:hypothetical protein VC83_01544 [Pseudogymnoascus destructans]|uniref:Uncharacterized protein n=2 Tax=Pseudogymnoascus destructans TaxID=655981 RepID=L8FZ41_PSED2|nr:uncharacterized protein VC83_01544 [Pseudogymnoascus destructans]ELR06092.1 hypothetical protein GMDG_01966 [Pseudogymnoascus destructans 20631-21]OAF61970.1 hypothetical protein VC83_01544 [Pseudogymnoascus destructans]